MNGSLIPYTPIAVDFWKIRECPQARIFFLTHLHGDHITGLTSSWNYPIYCSEITGKLLVQRHGVRENLIHALQIECAEIIHLDSERQEQMTVTAIDANHCPGALMFLMQGYFGTILHTGDFRYDPSMINETVLSQFSGKVDILYLDNTYCSPQCVFPTRDEATQQIIDIIEQHPTKDVLLAMRALGKETLLCKIAVHFQEWISVPDKTYRTLEIVGAPNVFDQGSIDNRIRVVPFHKISNKFVNSVNEVRETIVIMPTALYHGIEATPYENNDKVFVVPYSDHSSFTELKDFVSFIKPKKIIPIVKGNARGPFGLSVADRADMTCFSKSTADGWNSKVDIPISVQAFMHKNNRILEKEPKGKKRKAKLKQPQTKKVKRGIDYDSPKSVSKDKLRSPEVSQEVNGSCKSENDKENLKQANKKTEHVKRILFEDKSESHDKALEDNGFKVKNEKTRRNQSRSAEQSSSRKIVEETNVYCKMQQSTVREDCKDGGFEVDLPVKDRNKMQKQDFTCNQKDTPNKLKTSQVKNKTKIPMDIIQKRSSGNMPGKNSNQIKEFECGALDGEIPKEYIQKKTAAKLPLQFVSSKQDEAFDRAVGIRTYSKLSSKRIDPGSKQLARATNVTDGEETTKINETAKWVLQSLEYGEESSEAHDCSELTLNTEKESIVKVDGYEKNNYQRKSNKSTYLKQSTLSQYVVKKSKEPEVKSPPSMDEKEIHVARKCIEKLGEEKRSKKNVSVSDLLQHEVEDKDIFSSDDEMNIPSAMEGAEKIENKYVIVSDDEDDKAEHKLSKNVSMKTKPIDENEDLVFEKDILEESVIANPGTQVCILDISSDSTFKGVDKVKAKKKANDKTITGVREEFSIEVDCLEKEIDHNCSVLESKPMVNETLNKSDSECCIETIVKDKNCPVAEDTSTLDVCGVERTKVNNGYEITKKSEYVQPIDTSTVAIVGTPREVVLVNRDDDTIIADHGRKGHKTRSKTGVSSGFSETYKDSCRICELDAFRKVLDKFDHCDLKCTKQTTSRCKAMQIECKKLFNNSFNVKPVKH